jgi:hypothetical protein
LELALGKSIPRVNNLKVGASCMADNIIAKTQIIPSMYLMRKTKHMQIIPFIVTISFNILVVDLSDKFVLKYLLRKSLYMTPDKVFKNAAIVPCMESTGHLLQFV